jgi:hypothetical protein
MWPKPSRRMVRRSWWKPYPHNECYKRPSNQPNPHAVKCGLDWHRATRLPCVVQSVRKLHAHALIAWRVRVPASGKWP